MDSILVLPKSEFGPGPRPPLIIIHHRADQMSRRDVATFLREAAARRHVMTRQAAAKAASTAAGNTAEIEPADEASEGAGTATRDGSGGAERAGGATEATSW